jgi:hypothetical protein
VLAIGSRTSRATQFVYSILGEGELVAVIGSYLIKAKSKNGVPDILESRRPTPPTATAALVEDPGRNTGEDGAHSVSESDAMTKMGKDVPPAHKSRHLRHSRLNSCRTEGPPVRGNRAIRI